MRYISGGAGAGTEILANLGVQVDRTTTVDASAKVLIDGFKAAMDAAVAEALANGATAQELAPVTDLSARLAASSTELAASVAANTPGAPPAPPAAR